MKLDYFISYLKSQLLTLLNLYWYFNIYKYNIMYIYMVNNIKNYTNYHFKIFIYLILALFSFLISFVSLYLSIWHSYLITSFSYFPLPSNLFSFKTFVCYSICIWFTQTKLFLQFYRLYRLCFFYIFLFVIFILYLIFSSCLLFVLEIRSLRFLVYSLLFVI